MYYIVKCSAPYRWCLYIVTYSLIILDWPQDAAAAAALNVG